MRNRSNRWISGIIYTAAVALVLLLGSPASQAAVSIGVSVNIAPPELPVYEQPPVPGPGYIWTPGYWAWDDSDYYWVPGTWVEAPQPGYLWTPGYWGWNDGLYIWSPGYWGPHIGFYGGVNYGFGYIGHGYEGGYWDHGEFRYNRAYNNIHDDVHITNVYNRTVIVNNDNRVSFNGGHGGIQARPGEQELAAEHDHHLTPLPAQLQHQDGARGNPALRASENHGRPPIAATPHAGVFAGQGVMPARTMAAPRTTTFSGGAPPHGPATQFMTPHEGGTGGPPPAAAAPHFAPGPGPAAPMHSSAAVPQHMGGAPPAHAPGGAGGMAPHGGPPPGSGHPGGGAPPPPHAPPHPQHEQGDREHGH